MNWRTPTITAALFAGISDNFEKTLIEKYERIPQQSLDGFL